VTDIVLFSNHRADLLLEDVQRFEDGSIKTGFVVNGFWDFERRDGEVLAKDGRHIVNRWPDPGYVEVPAPRGSGYQAIMNAAQEDYDRARV
jgi:hypothetical protein